ncbi:hypothetical protein ACWFMI_06630 [Nocardiopsis terrae]
MPWCPPWRPPRAGPTRSGCPHAMVGTVSLTVVVLFGRVPTRLVREHDA